jgi:uncharacterized protein
MRRRLNLVLQGLLCLGTLGAILLAAGAQTRPQDAELVERRNAVETELESIAVIEHKVMVPMRDGKRMQADIYRPRDSSKKLSNACVTARATKSRRLDGEGQEP